MYNAQHWRELEPSLRWIRLVAKNSKLGVLSQGKNADWVWELGPKAADDVGGHVARMGDDKCIHFN
jgi:hypothetical protein